MPAPPSSSELADLSAWAWVKRRAFSKRRRLFLKLIGQVVSAHASPKAPVEWDISLLRAAASKSSRRPVVLLTLPSGSVFNLLFVDSPTAAAWAAAVDKQAARDFDALYTLDQKIGEGAFASVHSATEKRTGRQYAVKRIKKKQFDMQMARELEREMYAMRVTDHPAVVRTHDVFNSQTYVMLVLDWMKGGTLKENVQAVGGRIPEHLAVGIVRQVLTALQYLHARGIVHRDIKLENVLCETATIPARNVRVADFGYVNFVNDHTDACLRSLVGTPVYVAPEIINHKPYGCPVDIYAVGVMLYRMLCGSYPFDAGEDDEATMNLALEGWISFDEPAWADTSIMCKNFIRALLQAKPQRRLTAKAALHHPWIEGATTAGTDAETNMSSPVSPYDQHHNQTMNRYAARLEGGFISDTVDVGEGSSLLHLGVGEDLVLSGLSDSPRHTSRREARLRWRKCILVVLFVIKVCVANGAKLKAVPKERRKPVPERAARRDAKRPPRLSGMRLRVFSAFALTPRQRRASEAVNDERQFAETPRSRGNRVRRTLSLNRS
ncbi:Serine/threonine protein kinase Rhodoplastic [Chondrus crispus]|uniref:Serine/threonine protein kinase Rhodoplastic n=1 Tax=Chondrus crispus TaxID=2769 RepID=R7QDL0_CHOCR|nr:Serine/threonine protein kinase Rhodoplastic [Chondrus crispus]CDF36602.1 Serine/threonine protein kinase Rhodoplastic [Chondrus crispus]|eukprot:XP_005716421.1 Serine/threonine protein kinase Rhodoplastic [Chondrus crispus]